MNLKLGVCWIEDQPSNAETEAVEDAIRACGFEPAVEVVKDQDEILACARQQRTFQEYELILLDFMLGGDLNGDELAASIRQDFRSTPILFYSVMPVDQLRTRMAEQGVDGVYCAARRDLANKVGELVSDLAPRLNRLSGMRGLAAQVVAECDEELRTILRTLTANMPEKELVQSLTRRARKAGTAQLKQLDKLTQLDELLGSIAISSVMLIREVKAQLETSASVQIQDHLYELRDYEKDILGRRNVLSHAIEERTEEGWRISTKRSDMADLTVDQFEEYRFDFLRYKECARRLRELVIKEIT